MELHNFEWEKDRMVTLITAYRVCQQKGGIGSTVYHQQQLDFEEEGKNKSTFKKISAKTWSNMFKIYTRRIKLSY